MLTDVTSYSVDSKFCCSCGRSWVISVGVSMFSGRRDAIMSTPLDLVVTTLVRLARLARRFLCASSISSILISFRMTVVHTKHTTYTVVTNSVLSHAQMYRSIQT